MKETILRWLGGFDESYVLNLEAKILSLEEKPRKRPQIKIDTKDPSPLDSSQRALYVAQVAGFHNDIMKPKIEQMISDLRSSFEKLDKNTYGLSQSEYDLYIKATINSLWLVYDWGESMINEQVANQQGVQEEELEVLKAKIK